MRIHLLPFFVLAGCWQPNPNFAENGSSSTTISEGSSTSETLSSGEGLSGPESVCGNGIPEGFEVCDGGEGCEPDCTWIECGDGFVNHQAGESCEVGELPSATCEPMTCRPPECGDGIENGEECDDGNLEDEDGCSNDCYFPRLVFVSSVAFSGDFGGILEADVTCNVLANDAGLQGDFRAWLSGSTPESAPKHRFQDEGFSGWFRRTDGELVARGWKGLAEFELANPIFLDEKGEGHDDYVWTNTQRNGEQTDLVDHCMSWTKTDVQEWGRVGHADFWTPEMWSDEKSAPCLGTARLYCFQVAG